MSFSDIDINIPDSELIKHMDIRAERMLDPASYSLYQSLRDESDIEKSKHALGSAVLNDILLDAIKLGMAAEQSATPSTTEQQD